MGKQICQLGARVVLLNYVLNSTCFLIFHMEAFNEDLRSWLFFIDSFFKIGFQQGITFLGIQCFQPGILGVAFVVIHWSSCLTCLCLVLPSSLLVQYSWVFRLVMGPPIIMLIIFSALFRIGSRLDGQVRFCTCLTCFVGYLELP